MRRSKTRVVTWWKKGLILTLGAGVFGVFGLTVYTIWGLPSVQQAEQLAFSQSTIIYDRGALEPGANPEEHILYIIHGDENRQYIPLAEISPSVIQATLAIEDDQFYRHWGFDLGGIFKAFLGEIGWGPKRGGSTITQQLIKNTFLSSDRTLVRKFNEILLALKVERAYTKDEILELYLNKIPYGHNAHGIEAAAQKFFGKSARQLGLVEASILASLPVAPTRFSPYGSNRDLLMGYYQTQDDGSAIYKKGRKDLVLERMLELEMITPTQFNQAWSSSKSITFQSNRTDIKAPHFVFYVREQLEKKYGQEFLRQGGLRIYTTLDAQLQERFETIVRDKMATYAPQYDAHNAAGTLIHNRTGEILAYVGGRDYFDEEHDGQVDVLRSPRQPGSSFKPFVYAAAFMNGFFPGTVVFDVETDFGGNYRPQNFDGEFLGPVSIRESLNRSLNIPAVKMAHLANPKSIMNLAKKLGIEILGDADQHGVALGIGVAEVEPLSFINAYQVWATTGDYRPSVAVLEIHDNQGRVLERHRFDTPPREGISAEISALVRSILTDESTRPTTEEFDWNQLLQIPEVDNGSKTGTSNRRIKNPDFDETQAEDPEENPAEITVPSDAWTIGFVPEFTLGAWVGNNRGQPMKPGATGLAVAAPIWKAMMIAGLEIWEQKYEPFTYPDIPSIKTQKINRWSGKLATESTPEELVVEELTAPATILLLDQSVEQQEFDTRTGKVADKNTPFYARRTRPQLKMSSLQPERGNWESPVQDWLAEHPEFTSSLGAVLGSAFSSDTSTLGDPSAENRSPEFLRSTYPQIELISPLPRGTVAKGRLQIIINPTARFGVAQVDYYWDSQLVDTRTESPWNADFRVPQAAEDGKTYLIEIVVTDHQGQSSRQRLPVILGPDTRSPQLELLGVINNQRWPADSLIQIEAKAWDLESAIERVEFLLNEKVFATDTLAPYQATFTTRGIYDTQSLSVIAYDEQGQSTTLKRSFIVGPTRPAAGVTPKIIELSHQADALWVQVEFPEVIDLSWGELVVSQLRNSSIVATQKIEDPRGRVFFSFPLPTGKYRFQLFWQKSPSAPGVASPIEQTTQIRSVQ